MACFFISLLFADLLWFEMPEADPMETQFIYIPKKLFLLRIAPTTSPGSSQWLTLEWVPFLPPGDLPDPGIEQASLGSPALAGRFFTTEPPRKPQGLITSPPCIPLQSKTGNHSHPEMIWGARNIPQAALLKLMILYT